MIKIEDFQYFPLQLQHISYCCMEHNKVWRRAYWIRDKFNNENTKNRTKFTDFIFSIAKVKWSWDGHMTRKSSDEYSDGHEEQKAMEVDHRENGQMI